MKETRPFYLCLKFLFEKVFSSSRASSRLTSGFLALALAGKEMEKHLCPCSIDLPSFCLIIPASRRVCVPRTDNAPTRGILQVLQIGGGYGIFAIYARHQGRGGRGGLLCVARMPHTERLLVRWGGAGSLVSSSLFLCPLAAQRIGIHLPEAHRAKHAHFSLRCELEERNERGKQL